MTQDLLTDEEIQTFKNRLAIPGSQGHYQEWMNCEMQQAINTIEALKAENKRLQSHQFRYSEGEQ